MSPLMSIVLLAILIAVWLLYRSKNNQSTTAGPKRPTPPSPRRSSEFHAVSIKYVSSACEAARSMKDKRFLSNEAPRLPLPDCDVVQCKCRFVHYRDRRTGEDRRDQYAGSIGGGTGEHEQDQRRPGDRRVEPPDEF